VHNNLGNALAAAGLSDEAITEYREALRLNPDYAPAHRGLGEELRRAGRGAEAEEQLEEARRLGAAAPEPGR
jgi:Flp pilus assembly protein TadD